MKKPLRTAARSICLLIILLQSAFPVQTLGNASYSQVVRNVKEVFVSVDFNDDPLSDVFLELEKKTEFRFVYDKRDAFLNNRFSLQETNISVEQVLLTIAQEFSLKFRQLNNNISVNLMPGTKKSEKEIEVVIEELTVSGKVTSSDGNEPLPGVTVLLKGTTIGTSTDVEGKYVIKVPDGNGTLIFSFIGYISQEISINSRSTIDVSMAPDVTTLQEIVVVGYGEVERRDLTSSVSSISNKQIKDIPINSAAQALTGRLAGVQVTAAEGSPDATVQIRVRGGGSITQDNSPIYIVDGVQVENALAVLSPQDIESIDVLKDAAATSIYGARGANGIVIITTKGGKQQKLTIAFNSLVGVRQLANKLDVWKPYDFVNYQYERSRGSVSSESTFLEDYGTFQDIELYKGVPFVDWQDEIFGRSALMQTYNLSATGGGKVTSYNVSLTSNKEEGIMLGSDFDRKLATVRLDNRITKWLTVGVNGRYNYTIVNGAGTAEPGSSGVNRLRHSVKYRPFNVPGQPLDYYDPEYALETNANSLSLINPILLTKQEYKQSRTDVGNVNGYLSFKLTDYLTFKSTLGYDISKEEIRVFNDTITNQARSAGGGQPIASIDLRERAIFNNSNVLTFSSTGLKSEIFKDHKFDVALGHEIYEKRSDLNFRESRLFPKGTTPDEAFNGLETLGVLQPNSRTQELTEKLLSFFGRVNYIYRDKYLVTLSYRGDGSSKFSEGNKWGYFPGASIAWRVSNEPFFSNLTSVFDNLKLRASYGSSGNNRIDDFLYLSLFEPGGFYSIGDSVMTGFVPSGLANANLKWEGIVSTNLGMDVGFFNGRLQFSADYYQNSSVDLLLQRVVPAISGYTTQIQNIGETSNKGVEIQLSATPVDKKNFKWTTNFNISFNKNRIESLGPTLTSYLQPSGWGGGNQPADFIVKVGEPVGAVWGLITDGYYTVDDFEIDANTGEFVVNSGNYVLKAGVPDNRGITSVAPRPGVLKFKDITDDNLITDADRTIIGNTSPKFFGGWNHQFTYKNFDLSVFVNFQYGNDVVNANKLEFTSGYTVSSNLLSIMSGRWTNINAEGQVVTNPAALTELNQNATIWSPLTSASSFYTHSWAIEDGSFLRINNVTLGYTISSEKLEKLKIKNLRVYTTLNNLAVLTNYSGYDPEVNTRRSTRVTPGVDFSAYPRSRGYIVGLNLTF